MTQDDDARQSPIGFYLLGLSYLGAADKLTASIEDQAEAFRLRFDLPVRHLYAHGWELCLKACLYQQGIPPNKLKTKKYGHSLCAIWREVDRDRFAPLNLKDEIQQALEVLDQFHPTKLYAYPITGSRNDFSLTFIRAMSGRFKLPRESIGALFSAGPIRKR